MLSIQPTIINSAKTIKSIANTAKTDYVLKKRMDKLSVNDLPANSWLIPNKAVSFSYVNIGKKSNPAFKKEVTTFYDDKNNIITRCFNDNDKVYKRRNYEYYTDSHNESAKKYIREIITDEYTPKNELRKRISKNLKILALIDDWKVTQDEIQSVSQFKDTPAKKLSILKKYHYDSDKKRSFTLTEYPATCGFESKNEKKELKGDIYKSLIGLRLSHVEHSPNVSIDRNDKFLPYRLLNSKEKCEELPFFYLRRHKLDGMWIKSQVVPASDAETIADFSPSERMISWYGVPKDVSIANTAAHEVEHAYQHAQIGRLGKGTTIYENDCKCIFGEITDKNERLEAKRYAHARDIYPSENDANFAAKYDNNYLEQCSNKAGDEAEIEYCAGQNLLKKIFKNFPDTINMF